MAPKYIIRPATPADYWYCYRLTKRNMLELFTRHWGGWVPAKFREGFHTNAVSVVVINGRRAGYLCVTHRKDGLYLDNIQLSPAMRGRGIGTSILKQLLGGNPSSRIRLTTFADNPAKRLYERLGFVTTGRRGMTIKMTLDPRKRNSAQPAGGAYVLPGADKTSAHP